MMATLKSEMRKLLSTRSTYITVGLALLLIGFMAFYIEGYRGLSGSSAANATSTAIHEIFMNAGATVGIFAAITGVLFMVHEYRYNLITYTLTASNGRLKVLLAKIIVILSYSLIFSVVAVLFGIVLYLLGLALAGKTLPPQDWFEAGLFGKILFYNAAYGLIGMLIGVLTRSTLAIVVLIIFPLTVEPLLSLLLKQNAVYLPFAALERILASGSRVVSGELTPERAMLVTLAYLAAGWTIAAVMFRRRDAL